MQESGDRSGPAWIYEPVGRQMFAVSCLREKRPQFTQTSVQTKQSLEASEERGKKGRVARKKG